MVQSVNRFTTAFWTENGEKRPLIRTPCPDAPRRLGILSQTEDSLWLRFFAFFRADPCLRLLNELEEDLKQKVQKMTVRWLLH